MFIKDVLKNPNKSTMYKMESGRTLQQVRKCLGDVVIAPGSAHGSASSKEQSTTDT